VELKVLIPGRLAGGERRHQARRRRLDRLQLVLGAMLRREPGGHRLDGDADFEGVQPGPHLRRQQVLDHVLGRPLPDEGSGSAARLDQAIALQPGERLADDRPRDRGQAAELMLRRQTVALVKVLFDDEGQQLTVDAVGEAVARLLARGRMQQRLIGIDTAAVAGGVWLHRQSRHGDNRWVAPALGRTP
jgi:hypothetical protein